MHILLTGISGFIGKRTALAFLDAGHHVRGSVRDLGRTEEVRGALAGKLADPAAIDRLSFVALDLTSDAGWSEAAQGTDVVVHTASPFPMAAPKDVDADLIRPAVDGTLRALRAARDAGVTRVVLTSSMAAVMNFETRPGQTLTPEDWSEIGHPTLDPYSRSKTEAERAAWAFVAENPEMQLTTINPGLVLGTPVDDRYGTSLALVERLLAGRDPMIPDFQLPVVDVADVALMHVRAAERPETAGKRYLAVERFLSFPEIADILRAAYPQRKIPSRIAPKWLLRVLSIFDASVKTVLPTIGRRLAADAEATRRDLGIDFTPAPDSVLSSAEVLTE